MFIKRYTAIQNHPLTWTRHLNHEILSLLKNEIHYMDDDRAT